MIIFSERLRARRESLDISVDELSEIIGIKSSVYYKYEQGATLPKTNKLIQLSQHLKCSIDYLMGVSDESDSNPVATETTRLVLSLPPDLQDVALMVVNGLKIHSDVHHTTGLVSTRSRKKLNRY